MIRDIPTRWLLLLAFLVAGLAPVVAVALVSYATGRTELKAQAFRQLESVRDGRLSQLGRFFDERRRDVELLARDPYLRDAFGELCAAFRDARGSLAGLDRRRFEAPAAYRAVHDQHFPYLSRFVDRRGYYDLLLLDPVSGEVCFSVEKERDFAVPVTSQPTALLDVWSQVVREGADTLSDTRPYPPSANAAAQFVAAPILGEGPDRLLGVVALQISLSEVDAIMGERSGMGVTGDLYLVGEDFRPRSDSSRDPARTVAAAFRAGPGSGQVRNLAVERALAGERSTAAVTEPDRRTVLAAFAPFDLAAGSGPRLRWALVAQTDEAEIDAQIDRALNPRVAVLMLLSGLGVVALALLLSALIARSIGSVRTQLGQLSDAVLRGELHLRAEPDAVAADFRGVVRNINELVDAFVLRLDSIPVPVALVDRALRVQFANAAACALRGTSRAALVGKPCGAALGAGCAGGHCLVQQAMDRNTVLQAELAGGPEQPERRFLVTASPMLGPGGEVVGGFEVVVDQTEAHRMEQEKRRLEDRVARMQRLEAVGTLAGGIAHDFNNILTYMFAYVDIVQGLLPEDAPARPHLAELTSAIQRAADLVGQVLTFSRQGHGEPVALELGPLVKEAVKLVQAGLPPSIEVRVRVPTEPLTVMANPAQLHQVVMNLLTNAHQSMEGTGGRLEVELSEVPETPPRVRLRVADTGCGMSPRTLERIFEPFFTTKPVGKGTGMGLALVHGIVAGCGGEVLVESEPGRGSVFQVLLPRASGSPPEAGAPPLPAPARGENILVVDDERRVCEVTLQLLQSLGYRATTFTDGAAALAELRAHPDRYQAVLTDLRMPGVSGLEVATAVRQVNPKLPVILTTAHADGVTPEAAKAAGVSELVLKPYRRGDLAHALHGLLFRGGPEESS